MQASMFSHEHQRYQRGHLSIAGFFEKNTIRVLKYSNQLPINAAALPSLCFDVIRRCTQLEINLIYKQLFFHSSKVHTSARSAKNPVITM